MNTIDAVKVWIAKVCWPLLDWYEARFGKSLNKNFRVDPLLAMKGMWKGLWKDEKPDAYVQCLRRWD